MKTNIMVDIETMGTAEGSAVLAIGAVTFHSQGMDQNFYRTCTLHSALESGFSVDASTIIWWMKQSEEARAELINAGMHIATMFAMFQGWVLKNIDDHSINIWCNGANFDGLLLRAGFQKLGLRSPWHQGQERCHRTIMKTFGCRLKSKTEADHNAISDARSQALELIPILNRLDAWE